MSQEQGTAQPVLVEDIPIWEDCPYASLLPEGFQIRLGNPQGTWVMLVCWAEHELHVALDFATLDPESMDKTLEIVISNLVGARFDQEFPGFFPKVIEASALATAGVPVPPHLAAAMARLGELDAMIPRALPGSPGAVSPVQRLN